jgi:hypothetical protein
LSSGMDRICACAKRLYQRNTVSEHVRSQGGTSFEGSFSGSLLLRVARLNRARGFVQIELGCVDAIGQARAQAEH